MEANNRSLAWLYVAISGIAILHYFRTEAMKPISRLSKTPRMYVSTWLDIIWTLVVLLLKHLPGPLSLSRDLPKELSIDSDSVPYVVFPKQEILAPMCVDAEARLEYDKVLQDCNQASGSTAHARHGTASDLRTITGKRIILGPISFPLIPLMLRASDNPTKPVGGVNVRNRFRWYRGAEELYDQGDPGNGSYLVRGAIGGVDPVMRAKRVKRGLEWDTIIKIYRREGRMGEPKGKALGMVEKVDERDLTLVFGFTFTSLSALPPSQLKLPRDVTSSVKDPQTDANTHIDWIQDPLPLIIPDSVPSTYASLSRDYNPIHISSILARLFGFKRKIAHGNLVAMLVLERAAAVDSQSSGYHEDDIATAAKRLFKARMEAEDGATLDIQFRRPVFVPSKTMIRWSRDGITAEVVEVKDGEHKVLIALQLS